MEGDRGFRDKRGPAEQGRFGGNVRGDDFSFEQSYVQEGEVRMEASELQGDRLNKGDVGSAGMRVGGGFFTNLGPIKEGI